MPFFSTSFASPFLFPLFCTCTIHPSIHPSTHPSMPCKCKQIRLAVVTDLRCHLPPPAYAPYPPVELTARSEWTPPLYPPRTNNGPYVAGDSESSIHYTDSPKFNGSLQLRTESQPRPMSPTQRRPSKWRLVVNRSRRFARFTYATCLILVLVIWGVVNLIFTMREHIHETVCQFD